jgi:hypothetical protein
MKKIFVFVALLFLGVLTFSTAKAETKTLTGYVFLDNNWISLNCIDEDLCATTDYKVLSDENNNLFGSAYSEVTGLINFNNDFGGVKINLDNEITGLAVSEKTGLIYFNGAKNVLFDNLNNTVSSAETQINLINSNTASISESEIMQLLKQLCEAVFGKSQCEI